MPDVPEHLLMDSIDVERATAGNDTAGTPTLTWASHLSSISAHVRELAGDEARRFGRTSTRRTLRIYVASSHDITTQDRVVYDSTQFNILEVVLMQAPARMLRLTAERIE